MHCWLDMNVNWRREREKDRGSAVLTLQQSHPVIQWSKTVWSKKAVKMEFALFVVWLLAGWLFDYGFFLVNDLRTESNLRFIFFSSISMNGMATWIVSCPPNSTFYQSDRTGKEEGLLPLSLVSFLCNDIELGEIRKLCGVKEVGNQNINTWFCTVNQDSIHSTTLAVDTGFGLHLVTTNTTNKALIPSL